MHIVRWKNISDVIGLSKSTVARKMKEGTFPVPMRLSENTVGWAMADINKWIEEQAKADRQRKGIRL
jgi:prophage regulatory protein